MNPLYPRILWAKFGLNWPRGSGEDDENVKSWQQRKQEWRGRQFKLVGSICWDWPSCSGEDYINTVIHIYIFPILQLFSFWYLCFEQIWVPFSQGCILPSLNEIAWTCGSEGEYENVKNFTITTDKSQLTFISGELKRGNVYTWLFGTVW